MYLLDVSIRYLKYFCVLFVLIVLFVYAVSFIAMLQSPSLMVLLIIVIIIIIVITTITLMTNLVVEAPLVYTSVVPAPSYSPVSDLVSYYKLCRLIKLSIIVMLI